MEQQELFAVLAGLAVFLLLVAVGGAVYFFKGSAEAKPAAQPQQAAAAGARGGAGRRLAAGARRRRQQAAQAADDEEEEDDVDAQGRPARQPDQEQKYTRKDELHVKLHEAVEAYEERRRQRDAEREAQQQAEEEEAARKQAEREAAQDAEAAKWLGQISTENEGTGAADSEEQLGLLHAFVSYIEDRKTVVLEDLAADFGLRVQDVIARVQTLESEGRITGVMDDRGKFVFISKEEMKAVADYIQRRGRITIAELAAKSNQFIDLETKAANPNVTAGIDLDLDDEDAGEA